MSKFALVKGTPEEDFFKQNPELQYRSSVKRLIRKVGKKEAGRIMWAVYLTEDLNSTFYPLRTEEKRMEVAKNYLEDEDFDWDEYESLIEDYPNMAMGVEARNYKRLNDKFQAMLSEVEGADLKLASTFYSKLDSIYKGLERAKEMYDKENAKASQVRGSEEGGMFNR